MTERTGGELLVDCLLAQGADTIFGVPGESYLPVLDALYGTADRIRVIMCRQEGGAAFMAAAYGKLTGRPGLCIVTRGPGATNAAIGVHTAAQDSTPMILLVGQVERAARGREAFQEIDYQQFFGSVAKWVVEVDDAARLPEIMARAHGTALNGRPGPVVISLPEDMLHERMSVAPGDRAAPVLPLEPAPASASIDQVCGLLSRAQRPLLWVGGSGWRPDGRAALKRFAEVNDLPVIAGFRWQDLFDNHHACYVGDAGVGMTPATRALIDAADVIVAVGFDLGEITTEGYSLLKVPQPAQTLIHVHPSDQELGKVYQPACAVNAGPNSFFAALADRPPMESRPWSSWRAEARKDFLASLDSPAQPGGVDAGQVMAWLRDNLPRDVIITNGAGNFTIWPNKFFLFGEDARLLAPQSGAMGYGIPAAVAARTAEPGRMVVCFAGDGDFQMTGQELVTGAQHEARPIVILLNNGIYGTIRMHQERNYPGRVVGTALQNPDFQVLAQAYGYHGERVTETAAFPAAFERAAASGQGAIIELVIDPEAITPRQTLSQIRDQALKSKT